MRKRPLSYEVSPCCGTCAHVFVWIDYDCEREYFCHVDGSKRPLCGSVSMREPFSMQPNGDRVGNVEFRRLMRAWEKWSEPRAVAREGTCAEFYHKEES